MTTPDIERYYKDLCVMSDTVYALLNITDYAVNESGDALRVVRDELRAERDRIIRFDIGDMVTMPASRAFSGLTGLFIDESERTGIVVGTSLSDYDDHTYQRITVQIGVENWQTIESSAHHWNNKEGALCT